MQDDCRHWSHISGVWQVVHERRYGSVVVAIPEEVRDHDHALWVGRTELLIDEAAAYYPDDAAALVEQLQLALIFARDHDRRIAARARAGQLETSVDDLDIANHDDDAARVADAVQAVRPVATPAVEGSTPA